MEQGELKQKILKNDDRLSEVEIEQLIAEIEIIEKEMARQEELAKNADPFWHYKPSTGLVTPEARAFLMEWLKEEDIPARLDGQLDVHMSLKPIRGASGGNQSGKTTTGAIEALIQTTGELPDALKECYPKEKLPQRFPQHVRVTCEDYINGILLNVKPTYQFWAPKDFLLNGKWEDSYSSEQGVLTLYEPKTSIVKGTIEFMSNKQDVGSFQGPPRDMMIYDEEPRKDIRQENLLRFTTRDRVNELYCMTPTKGMTWVFSELFQLAQKMDPSVDWFQLPSVGNAKANLKVLQEIMKNITDYETRKMRLLGEFISLAGLIYGKVFDRRVHVVEPFELDQTEWVIFRGLDPHTAKPSVAVEVAFNRDGQVVVCGAYKKAVDTDEFKKDLRERAIERKYRLGWSACDKSANTTNRLLKNLNIYKLLKEGENRIPSLFLSEKFTGSIKAGVDVIKVLLKARGVTGVPQLVIFNLPELKGLIESFQSLERETYANEDEKGQKDEIAEGRHDEHAALRYVFQRSPRWYAPPVAFKLPEPASNDTGY